ncbi:MAG: hypothetical protein QNJ90_12330 [Planctomycetota bacterium]|nr:hypothetical protein [Planctomycetota bacterium]
MHARSHVVVLLAFALAIVPLAWAEEGRQSGAPSGEPPSITYPGSRESSTWVEKPDGTRVAVGKGVEWQGVKVYLSLLWDLVGVDAKTGKTLYAVNVGAFWNAIGFKQVTPRGGAKTWAVELRPGPRARQGSERRQYHDLRTGRKLSVPGLVKAPSGKRFEPRAVWSGKHTRIAKPFHTILTTQAEWSGLKARLFGTDVPKALGRVDFDTEVALVISEGNGWNGSGVAVAEAYEDKARLLVRTQRRSFQTMNGAEKVRVWAVVVLPRRPAKAYVVERNRQGLIGGPPIWKRSFRLQRLGKPGAALEGLPPATDEPHKGWER